MKTRDGGTSNCYSRCSPALRPRYIALHLISGGVGRVAGGSELPWGADAVFTCTSSDFFNRSTERGSSRS